MSTAIPKQQLLDEEQPQSGAAVSLAHIVCVVLLPLLLALPLISLPEVSSSTDAREIHVSQLMIEQDNWVLPLRNGKVPSRSCKRR